MIMMENRWDPSAIPTERWEYYNAREDYAQENRRLDRRDLTQDAAVQTARRRAVLYTLVTILCFAFAKIYSLFAHGVHSPYMTFLFAWPLVLGWLPAVIQWLRGSLRSDRTRTSGRLQPARSPLAANLYHSGIAALAAGSLLRGICEIAGTSSPHQTVLMVLGAGMVVSGFLIGSFSALRGGVRRSE